MGVGKTLTPAGSVNDGNSGDNYAVTFARRLPRRRSPCSITVTAATNTKTYDGTTSAAAVPTITGGSLATGDTAAFSETYDNPNVGTGKTLTPAGSVNDGNSGNNYQVTFDTDTTGAITQTADHFLVVASPTSIPAGSDFILVVTAEDAGGNVVTGYAGTVGFSSSDPREPAQAPPVTFTPGSGVAYAVASLQTAGSWTITASDGDYTGTSAAVTVTAAAASQIVLSQPGGVSAGAAIPPLTAKVEDPYGNLESSYNGNVALALASGPGLLLGATAVQAVGGVATLSNLSIDQAGSYTLSASTTAVGGAAASSPFTVAPGRSRNWSSPASPSSPTTAAR